MFAGNPKRTMGGFVKFRVVSWNPWTSDKRKRSRSDFVFSVGSQYKVGAHQG